MRSKGREEEDEERGGRILSSLSCFTDPVLSELRSAASNSRPLETENIWTLAGQLTQFSQKPARCFRSTVRTSWKPVCQPSGFYDSDTALQPLTKQSIHFPSGNPLLRLRQWHCVFSPPSAFDWLHPIFSALCGQRYMMSGVGRRWSLELETVSLYFVWCRQLAARLSVQPCSRQNLVRQLWTIQMRNVTFLTRTTIISIHLVSETLSDKLIANFSIDVYWFLPLYFLNCFKNKLPEYGCLVSAKQDSSIMLLKTKNAGSFLLSVSSVKTFVRPVFDISLNPNDLYPQIVL